MESNLMAPVGQARPHSQVPWTPFPPWRLWGLGATNSALLSLARWKGRGWEAEAASRALASLGTANASLGLAE